MTTYTPFSSQGGLFVCANSGFGFVSYFNELLQDSSTLYLVKGGPGTGKSGLMKKVWQEAEKRALPVLPILCSSDPSSLDGLILPEAGVAFADATAPHLLEPLLPGAREQIADTGRFWNASALAARKKELELLSLGKKELYSRAYLLLEAAKNAALCRESLSNELLDLKKGEQTVSRWAKKVFSKKGKATVLFQKALSMRGALISDALLKRADCIVTILPRYAASTHLLELLLQKAREKEQRMLLLLDPLTLKPDALYFEESRCLFRCGDALLLERERIVDPRRLLSSPEKSRKDQLKRLEKSEEMLVHSALELLSEVKDLHFKAEEIYGSAMDFSSLEEYENELLSSLF